MGCPFEDAPPKWLLCVNPGLYCVLKGVRKYKKNKSAKQAAHEVVEVDADLMRQIDSFSESDSRASTSASAEKAMLAEEEEAEAYLSAPPAYSSPQETQSKHWGQNI